MSVCVCALYGARLLRCWCGAVRVVDQSKVLESEVKDGRVGADALGGPLDR